MTVRAILLIAMRAGLAGLVCWLAVSRFAGSSLAAWLDDLLSARLASLPLGSLADVLNGRVGVFVAVLALVAPATSAITGRGSRSVFWLVVVACILVAPSTLAASSIDWLRFLGDRAHTGLQAADASATVATVVALGIAASLFALWQIDRLQVDLGRLEYLGQPPPDIRLFAAGQVTTAVGVAAGGLLLAGIAFGITRSVLLVTGAIDPRSWLAVGAVGIALIVTAATVAAVATARGR